MTDDQRLMRYATAIARDELDYLCGPEYPLPGEGHPYWTRWKETAAVVIKLADTEHPPPPGSTAEQIPEHLLALIVRRPYVSTACETGRALQSAMIRHPEYHAELDLWLNRMHDRCRLNNKFTGVLCGCGCHAENRRTVITGGVMKKELT